MKKPVLMIGILFMAIFLMDLNRRGLLSKRKELLKATSCRAALVKLDRRIPKNWKTNCKDNDMEIEIPLEIPSKLSSDKIKSYHYRKLANNLVTIAIHSPVDNLELTGKIHVKMTSDQLIINAYSKGEEIVKLASMTNTEFISKHLQKTVKITEQKPTKK
ncbi:MAG: hypothetical protein OXB84_07415 [Halobacteriovoraceae bacterium]|nr:hypothetical protein [Halobacteriovoraceae bacterium]